MENSESQGSGTSNGLTPFKKFATIFVLSLALSIIILDTTLLNVSLSSIIKEFNTDIQSLQWVITAYALTLAALTITGGRFGDLFGRKKMFILGAIIFAVGSFITSISKNIPVMILGESLIEGVGAALMMPATSSILMATFRGRDRAMAFGIWGGVAGASSALGPIVGGYLSTHYSWRWGFRINVLVAAFLILGSLIIKESRDREEKPELDLMGVLLSSTGLLSLVFGVIESSKYGWFIAKEAFSLGSHTFNFPGGLSIVPFAIGLGLELLLIFVSWELSRDKKGRTPLVSMKLFANRQYVSGVATTLVLSLAMTGIIFSVPVFLQAVRGYTPLKTGLSLLPLSLGVFVTAPFGAYLTGKVRPKLLIQIGLLGNVSSMIVLRSSFSVHATNWDLAPGLALFGLGMGLVMSQINNLTLSAVSPEEAGEASGVNNTFRQVGSSFGSAIIGAILLGALSTNLVNGINASEKIPESVKPKIAEAISKQSSSVEFGTAKFDTKIPPAISQEIISISHQATVDANKKALAAGALFAILGFLVSFTIPNVENIEKEESLAAGH